jgi:hypothetical protein
MPAPKGRSSIGMIEPNPVTLKKINYNKKNLDLGKQEVKVQEPAHKGLG